MAVANFSCPNCSHSGVCKLEDKVSIFNDVKKDLGIEITMDACRNFKTLEDLEEE